MNFKHILAIIISLWIMFVIASFTVMAQTYIPGDVNGDGVVNNKDLGTLRRYLNDWDVEIDEYAANVNGDGDINNKDLGLLRRYLNDWDVVLSGGTTGECNHVEVIDEAVAPTCTKTGLTEGKHCSLCNEILVAQTTVAALNHNYQNGICVVCGDKKVSNGLRFALNPDGNSYCVKSIGSCSDTDIVIPSTYNGKPVTTIAKYAFSFSSSLISITMPDTITNIENDAFYNCTSLKSVIISNNILSVGSNAFYNCYSLKRNEFDNAYYLGSEENPYLVLTSAKATYLTSCIVHEDAKIIAGGAFESCAITNINIPSGLVEIGTDAFSLCKSITSINVSESNKYYASIDGNLYSKDGTTLIQYALGKSDKSFSIPSTVTRIGKSAFRACESLIKIDIHDGVLYIDDMAFFLCTHLSEVNIGDGVISVGDSAFKLCLSLKTITIGDSVAHIGDEVFNDCLLLTTISVSKNNNCYRSIDDNLYSKDGKTLLQYAVGKNNASFVIPIGVEVIGDWAFYNCKTLVEITISEGVTSIGGYAFCSCESLYSINIPDNVLVVGVFAFRGCKSLTSVNIGNGITVISDSAFASCTNLISVSMSNNVTSIGDGSFSYCTALSNIVVPNSVTTIGDDAFYCCTALSSVSISNSVTSIGSYAFYACDSLTTIRFNATKSDWDKISKGRSWDFCTAEYKIYCTNGTITKTT